jgi:hypothetical protein
VSELERDHLLAAANTKHGRLDHQQRILDLAADMGADPKEVKAAIRVMQSGRADLIIEILAARMSVKRRWQR